jgi:hypothetical protein
MAADDERLRVAAERAGIKWWGCDTADHMADEIHALRAEIAALKAEVAHLTHQILTCGVAATHPDASLSRRTKDYGGPWDSPQAERVREVRGRAEKAEAALVEAVESRDGWIAALRKAEAELRQVDEALARRDALADAPNRYTAIFRACTRAGDADKAEAERDALKAEVERLREALEQIIREAETIDEAEAIAREAGEVKP